MVPDRFRLKRYFSIASLIGVLVAVTALSLLYRVTARQALVEHETQSNVALTRAVSNTLLPRYMAWLAGAGALSREALAADPQLRQLDRDMRDQIRGLNVVKAKIFLPNGSTVYSTDLGELGRQTASLGFSRALGGEVSSELSFRDEYYALEGYIADRNLVSTYIPVRAAPGAPVQAVFEIYSDVTPLTAEVARTQARVTAGLVVAFALLYLFLYLIVRRADRLLVRQEQRRLEDAARMRHQAFHDPLTGLPNRASFHERLRDAVARAKRSGRPFGLMFIDLDRFKVINDSLGHSTGDQLLQVAARRIRAATRESDPVFRMGGDEFTVLLEGLETPEESAAVAERIVESFAVPSRVGEHELMVSPSIGLSTYPADANLPEDLVKAADTAMYRAKELGGCRFQFFAKGMNVAAMERLELETALQRALQQDQFTLYYQPKVRCTNGEIVGVEALLRWRHPSRGIVGPTEFIPFLEESGLILPVGEWVMREACRQNKRWQDEGRLAVRVSVNVSARQFRSELFTRLVRDVLQSTGLPAKYLELELTESLLVDNTAEAIRRMEELKELGVILSIDDFGTGYSSLSYLKHFPVDYLKVDRSFIADLHNNVRDDAIASSIAALARSLQLGVVAEGVEHPDQVEFLQRHGYDELQGFLFARPQPPETVEALLGDAAPVDPSRAKGSDSA